MRLTCPGCGHFYAAFGVHRADCTTFTGAEPSHAQALATVINAFEGKVRISDKAV